MKKIFLVLLMLQIAAVLTYSQMIQQWDSKYDGPEGYDDWVSDIVVDASGNVYVTGSSIDSTTGTTDKVDYSTVKYNSSGVQEWSAIYNGPADLMDYAYSIGVDDDGNVYVTGGSSGSDTIEEWATVKYNAFGVQLWVQRWQGLSGAPHNRAVDMVVDAFGNVYVTGHSEMTTSQGNFEGIAYVTIKYNTDGVQEWISTYNHPITNYPTQDKATSITMDNIGNIYVTGTSSDTLAGGQWMIATIKYNSTGVQQWVSRHPGSMAAGQNNQIITDNLGNAFVTGVYTIKYNSDGAQQTLNSPSGFTGTDLAVDLSGNLYVAGIKYGNPSYKTTTIKYNAEGDSLWSRNVNSVSSIRPKIAFDNCLGYIYVSTTIYIDIINSVDYLTVRYNSLGDSLFSINYNPVETPVNISVAMAVDEMANVYVTGYSSVDQLSDYDFTTVKYTPSSFFIHALKKDGLNKEIKDNQSTSDSTFIDCSLSNYTIADVEVVIDELIHTKDSDLEIYLLHSGTTENAEAMTDTLVYQVGGTGQNFIGTIFSDSAAISIIEGSAPFTGKFRPINPLSHLNGLSMEGNWVLKIYDGVSGNEGILKAWSINFGLSSQSVGIQEISGEVPGEINLSQNYPNPFNPITSIKYIIDSRQFVNLKVYDLLGREVATLVNEEKPAGTYEIEFDAKNLSSGIYFYKLQSGSFVDSKKMIYLK